MICHNFSACSGHLSENINLYEMSTIVHILHGMLVCESSLSPCSHPLLILLYFTVVKMELQVGLAWNEEFIPCNKLPSLYTKEKF